MIKVAIFYAVLMTASLYALRRGGGPERAVALLLVGAAIAASLVPFDPSMSYRGVEWGEFAIDSVLLAGLLVIAAHADRFWPIYVAAFQLLTVMTHVARAYDPGILPFVYARVSGELAYPGITLLFIGTWRHIRREPEADWTWQRDT